MCVQLLLSPRPRSLTIFDAELKHIRRDEGIVQPFHPELHTWHSPPFWSYLPALPTHTTTAISYMYHLQLYILPYDKSTFCAYILQFFLSVSVSFPPPPPHARSSMVYLYQPIPADSCCLSSFIVSYVGQSEMKYMSSFYFSSIKKILKKKKFPHPIFSASFTFSRIHDIMQKKKNTHTYIHALSLHLPHFLLLVCKNV